jgi:hypothetical protein
LGKFSLSIVLTAISEPRHEACHASLPPMHALSPLIMNT